MRPVVLLVALALIAPVAYAQEVPAELPHQGRLLDNGTPIDGSYSVRFAFYRNQTGGSPAWSETQTNEFDRRKQTIEARETDYTRWSDPRNLEAAWELRSVRVADYLGAGSCVPVLASNRWKSYQYSHAPPTHWPIQSAPQR